MYLSNGCVFLPLTSMAEEGGKCFVSLYSV